MYLLLTINESSKISIRNIVRDSTVGAFWFLRKRNKYKRALVKMFYWAE